MKRLRGGVGLSLAAFIVVGGCVAVTPRAPLQTSASYDDAFRAAAHAAVATGYQVKSSDTNAGVIAAERVYRQNKFKTEYIYLNISVTKGRNGSVVTADVQNPAGGFISHNVDYANFVEALKKQLPDLTVEQR